MSQKEIDWLSQKFDWVHVRDPWVHWKDHDAYGRIDRGSICLECGTMTGRQISGPDEQGGIVEDITRMLLGYPKDKANK